jgi:hypothetical protein
MFLFCYMLVDGTDTHTQLLVKLLNLNVTTCLCFEKSCLMLFVYVFLQSNLFVHFESLSMKDVLSGNAVIMFSLCFSEQCLCFNCKGFQQWFITLTISEFLNLVL